MTPYYRSDRALIFCGDTAEVLKHWTQPVATVITDTPYGDVGFLQQIADGLRAWEAAEVAVWLTRRLYAYQTWMPACKLMAGAGPLWVFQNLQYVPAFHALATALHWPPRQMWQVSGEEALLYCCTGRDLDAATIALIQKAAAWNTYGEKDPAWIAALVAASPDGPVFDPFCGRGSTLVAGLAAGRDVIGIELDEAACAVAVARVKEAEAKAA